MFNRRKEALEQENRAKAEKAARDAGLDASALPIEPNTAQTSQIKMSSEKEKHVKYAERSEMSSPSSSYGISRQTTTQDEK